MHSFVKSRKGVTLAEIIVAMALVAIMATMVVSFALLINERSRTNSANDAIQRDRTLIQSVVANWLDNVIITGEERLTHASDGSALAVSGVGGEESVLRFRYGRLTDGEDLNLSLESVLAVKFEVMEKRSSDGKIEDFIVFCTVEVENSESEAKYSYTFSVNPRIGEPGGVK